jgi:hypothetical protein
MGNEKGRIAETVMLGRSGDLGETVKLVLPPQRNAGGRVLRMPSNEPPLRVDVAGGGPVGCRSRVRCGR